MDSEKLIEVVRTHPSIYDLSDPKYSDATLKDKLWKVIGDELNQPGKYLYYYYLILLYTCGNNSNK